MKDAINTSVRFALRGPAWIPRPVRMAPLFVLVRVYELRYRLTGRL